MPKGKKKKKPLFGGKPNRKGNSVVSQWPKKLEDFCHNLHRGLNLRAAAVMAGLPYSSAFYHWSKPATKARLAEIEKEYKAASVRLAVEDRALQVEFLDENLMDVIVNGEGRNKKGRNVALLTGYKSKFMVDPPSPQTMIQIKNMGAGGAIGGLGGAPKLYLAQRFLKQAEPKTESNGS